MAVPSKEDPATHARSLACEDHGWNADPRFDFASLARVGERAPHLLDRVGAARSNDIAGTNVSVKTTMAIARHARSKRWRRRPIT
jgi:hypothetical protein